MALPVSFRWDEGFVARLDAARGLVSRSAFVREAVERLVEESEASGRRLEMMRSRERPNTVSEASAAIERAARPLPDEPSPLEMITTPEVIARAAKAGVFGPSRHSPTCKCPVCS